MTAKRQKKEKDVIDLMLDQLDFHGMTKDELTGKDGLLRQLTSRFYERILNACPGCTKKDKKLFRPHATVANRDIPVGIMTKALQVMNALNLAEDFPVDNIRIFERKGNRWEAGVTLELSRANC